jgi:LysR family glycine cleavage system transcriptional activator
LQERLIHVIGNNHGWSEWLEAAGVTSPRGGLSTQTDTSAVALALAASGAGVALGHASLLGDFAAGDRLVQPFDLGIETNGVFHLVSVSGRAIRREPAFFAKWLVEEAESDRAMSCRSLA